ncbi:MAG: preprotein translocase subunit SecE [Patescibacteria group bacterium]
MKNPANSIITFLKEVKMEMHRVNWPTKKELFNHTLAVVAISVAVAVFLGGLDMVFIYLLERFVL